MIQTQHSAVCDACGFKYQELFDEVVDAVRTVEAAGWRFYGGDHPRLLCDECLLNNRDPWR